MAHWNVYSALHLAECGSPLSRRLRNVGGGNGCLRTGCFIQHDLTLQRRRDQSYQFASDAHHQSSQPLAHIKDVHLV